ncbi:MAG: membrane protein insertase YidC [Verrucomicrobia bacterium]|jgi:YidC/Oxa1 family membrane protein insertase|nr:membrane protein insertase YidC [Verrucomicrobiota bacterium]
MDRKSIFILIFSIAGLILWFPLVKKLYPPQEQPQIEAQNREDQNAVDPTGASQPAEPVLQSPDETPAVTGTPSISISETEIAPTSTQEENLLVWENEDLAYEFTSLGGGIKTVTLKQYQGTTNCNTDETEEDTELDHVKLNADVPTPALNLFFGKLDNGFLPYSLKQEGDEIQAEYLGTDGIRVLKTFQPSTNYVLQAKIRIENTSDQPKSLPEHYLVTGTATPTNPTDTGMYMGMRYHNGEDIEEIKESWFANRTLGCFPGTPRSVYPSDAGAVHWASVDNQFFAMIAIPGEPAPALVTQQISLEVPGPEILAEYPKANMAPKGYQNSLSYPAQTLQPGEAIERSYQLFTGPKEYNTLAKLSKRTGQEVDAVMGFGGFFGFFAKALLLSMNGLHGFGLGYGLAIVVITAIIKLLFWPLTQASTRSMKRMSALQPQMKALQEKHKEDPQKMNKKLMEFMRENKVSPLGGCLPILLQLPVFFGFYTMLQSAIELRGASFLWTCDLSQPDTLFMIPMLGIPFNLWPILMGAAQLWQTSMTPPSPGMDPAQQKIMKYMPLMFVFILYNFSAGLALYWTVQNLLSIVQMKLIKNEPIGTKPGDGAAPSKPLPRTGDGPDWGQSYRKSKKKKQ